MTDRHHCVISGNIVDTEVWPDLLNLYERPVISMKFD